MISFLESSSLLVLVAVHAVWLSVTTGAALGMYLFAIPIIKTGPSVSSIVMLHQFHHLIDLGIRYMQTNSRIQVFSLATLMSVLYYHSDPVVASKWWYCATALLVCMQAIWYEVVFIFPTNDTLVQMEKELSKTSNSEAGLKVRPEVLRLLERWRRRHFARIVIPFVAASIMTYGLLA